MRFSLREMLPVPSIKHVVRGKSSNKMQYGQLSQGTLLLRSDHLAYFLGIPLPLEQDTVNWSSIFYSRSKKCKILFAKR
jgi:hypothetical protein